MTIRKRGGKGRNRINERYLDYTKRTPRLDARVEELLAQMTLEEKTGQMAQVHAGRLGWSQVEDRIRRGQAGSVLNYYGVAGINRL